MLERKSMLTPEELKERIILAGLCEPHKLRGCSEKDLGRIERHIGHELPGEYKRLLCAIGRYAGEFNSDVDMFYPKLVTLTERIRIQINEWIELPANAFIFASRYGEQVLFFHLEAGNDDPPVYRWHDESPKRFRKIFKSIWGYIEEELKGHEYVLGDD